MKCSALRRLAPILLLVPLCTSENRYCHESIYSLTIVESCPTTKAGWDAAARKKNCIKIASTQKCSSVDKFVYHCTVNGYKNVTLEVCAPFKLIIGSCVEFNVGGGVIQGQRLPKCNANFPKCDHVYYSFEAYKYPDCYELVSLNKTTYSRTAISRTNIVATAAEASTKQTTTYESDSTTIIGISAAVVSVMDVFSDGCNF